MTTNTPCDGAFMAGNEAYDKAVKSGFPRQALDDAIQAAFEYQREEEEVQLARRSQVAAGE